MSTFRRMTQHPVTKVFEKATWIDDFYGRHNYGIRFENGEMFDARDHDFVLGEPII